MTKTYAGVTVALQTRPIDLFESINDGITYDQTATTEAYNGGIKTWLVNHFPGIKVNTTAHPTQFGTLTVYDATDEQDDAIRNAVADATEHLMNHWDEWTVKA